MSDFILLETGDAILQEDGSSKLILDISNTSSAVQSSFHVPGVNSVGIGSASHGF